MAGPDILQFMTASVEFAEYDDASRRRLKVFIERNSKRGVEFEIWDIGINHELVISDNFNLSFNDARRLALSLLHFIEIGEPR